MACSVEVLFTPTEFRALRERDLSQTVCVVFDVLRATSCIVTALANGAEAIIPVSEIAEALAIRHQRPEILLAGERNGLRIGADLSGGVEFDLGNSPREYTPERVRDRTIVSTTTNGTRALRACSGARQVIVGSFLNLSAAVRAVLKESPPHLLLVCAGTGEGAALEDVLAAGAFCERMIREGRDLAELLDSARVAWQTHQACVSDLMTAISHAANGRRLLACAALREDVGCCLQVDRFDLVPRVRDGKRQTMVV